ncbi:MAG: hypothetical protein M9941_10090 [Anaerolineae bacterium]|nr:hypothetical protein [Anaerolineae bacterium]MCO5198077.1 hypothetical protein [Anaerolineae bacterium]
MNDIQLTGAAVLLFALRCLVPLALTLTIAYLMDRQMRRWGAEARMSSGEPACWETRNCPPERRNACAAYKRQGQPCWSARLEQDECLPEACVTCPLFSGIRTA